MRTTSVNQTTPTNPARFITVARDDANAWQAALTRFEAQRLWIQPLDLGHIVSGGIRAYQVESQRARSDRNQPHHTVLVWERGDAVRVSCDCERARLGGTDGSHICKHAAGALDEADAFPFLVLNQVAMTFDPPPGYDCEHCDRTFPNGDAATLHRIDHLNQGQAGAALLLNARQRREAAVPA